ncbi:hypothetical protein [Winogradskyella luteola]|uniref:Uncharacterized protein n=1 Tax=Winogradskyella luteola TaxID=2828330 RepID=A0A9X1F8B2_9FLAO|nr:hypothetical protein [Winogradskyella luteola]MBV7268468.1 hypothetical protein [Winogradskyella luteola]
MKKLVSPVTMFLFGVLVFAVIMIISNKLQLIQTLEVDPKMTVDQKIELMHSHSLFWFYRVLTALAAASISISIPGMISLNHKPDGNQLMRTNADGSEEPNTMSLLEKEPTISASGAIAVFVLVYLFNPLV